MLTVVFDHGGTLTKPQGFGESEDGDRSVDPEAVHILKLLHRSGYRLVLASNTKAGQHRAADLAAAGVLELFAVIMESHLLRVAKPDPVFYGMALAAADRPPGQVVWVGSNFFKDVVRPVEHGMRSVWLRRRGALGLDQALPDRATVISGLAELPKLLERGPW